MHSVQQGSLILVRRMPISCLLRSGTPETALGITAPEVVPGAELPIDKARHSSANRVKDGQEGEVLQLFQCPEVRGVPVDCQRNVTGRDQNCQHQQGLLR